MSTRKHPAATLKIYPGFGTNPGGLDMFAYVPEGLPKNAPLVVVLHGCGQSAAAYCRGSGWLTLADRFGFAVLAPGQSSGNNLNSCFNWFQPVDTVRGGGEAASIAQMIEMIVTDHHLDRRRVFVTGLSAGGAMASVMLATYPDIFAGGAIIAGLAYGAAQNVQEALSAMRHPPARAGEAWGDLVRAASTYSGPWPKVSVWQGDADWTVAPANAAAILDQWADVHGLARTPSDEDQIDTYPHRTWRSSTGDVVLEYYAITGMGHGTPIAAGEDEDHCGVAGPYILEAHISSTIRIAQFWALAPVSAIERPVKLRSPSPLRAAKAAPHKVAAIAPLPTAARGTVFVQKVIEDALTASGLLKRR